MSAALPRTLFLGRGSAAAGWYRCALPALQLDQDWVGVTREPPGVRVVAGVSRSASATFEDFGRYDVVVLQYQASPAWLRAIRTMQAHGARVLFEVDDYVQAVHKKTDHANAAAFGPRYVRDFEACMRACDGVICSTEWLAARYRALNPRVWVCRNTIDMPRYDFTRPASPWTTIGWAGGDGHARAVAAWLPAVGAVMAAEPATRFVTVGAPFARALEARFGAERCVALPMSPIETYPAAMAAFDVALAPARADDYYRGKSDLRWLEAGALGVPLVADPGVYPDIEDGVTGFHASSPGAVRDRLLELVRDPALRAQVGAAAREHVASRRSVAAGAAAWAAALREAVAVERAAA